MLTASTRIRVLALAGVLLLGGAAAAEPIQVQYLADQKAFKKGATATDALNFDLYSDDQCTTSIGSAQHFVGDSTIEYFDVDGHRQHRHQYG